MSKEAVPQDPGVEVERVPLLRTKEVRVLQVGAPQLVRSHRQGRVAHGLGEHQLRALVQRPGRGSLVSVHQRVRGRAGVAEGRGAEGLVRA